MQTFRGALTAVLTIPLLISSAAAQEWTVGRVAGQGWIVAEGVAAVPARSGAIVPPGSTLATGPNSRAMLVHGKDTVMLGPSTKIAIPYKPDRGLKATIIQQVGTVELSIEKLGRPHFSVQTPFLAAVVKGTEFKVAVTGNSAEVKVASGLVAVADLATGDKSEVGPGQAAGVSASAAGLRVSGILAAPAVKPGKARKGLVPSITNVLMPELPASAAVSGKSESKGDKGDKHGNNDKDGRGGKGGKGRDGDGHGGDGGGGGGGGDGHGGDGGGGGGGDDGHGGSGGGGGDDDGDDSDGDDGDDD